MNKLTIKKEEDEFYELEINDKGDKIVFDLTDINLPKKILDACDKITEINEEYIKKLSELEKEEDSIKLTYSAIEIENEICNKLKDAFDSFLGEGTCDKIFGESISYYSFPKLMDALEPHLQQMNIKNKTAKRRLAQKYMPKNSDVI